jgi:hypothetical protein
MRTLLIKPAARPALLMLPLKYPDAPPLPVKVPTPDEVRLFRHEPMVISMLTTPRASRTRT